MNRELKEAFDILDINTKRNQISNELILIHELIKNYEIKRKVNPITIVKNYDLINDEELNEDEMLTFLYEDIYNIEQELITLLKIVDIGENEN